jgi:CRISPR/Cas system-associated exonuclease Cas4 (RecB family)
MEQLFALEVSKFVDKEILKRTKNQEQRDYIGGSQIGAECSRKIQYSSIIKEPKDPVEPRVQRIFDLGNLIEDYLIRLLRDAGFDVRTRKDNGDQWGFSLADGRIQGHVDGVIMGGPKVMDYPCLVEFKSAKSSRFTKFLRDGLMQTDSNYYSQVQFYQTNMNLCNPALFVMMSKDDQNIYYELIQHNPAHASRLLDKSEDILNAIDNNYLMPKAYQDKNNWNCKYCDYKKECWSDDTIKIETPIWNQ